MDTIEHFGVKGMKWGTRRDQAIKEARVSTKMGRKGNAADRGLANHTTNGEKIVLTVLFGPFGIGGVAVNSIRARNIAANG